MYLRNLGKAIESIYTTKETTRALSDCQEEVEEGYIITSYTPETETSSGHRRAVGAGGAGGAGGPAAGHGDVMIAGPKLLTALSHVLAETVVAP